MALVGTATPWPKVKLTGELGYRSFDVLYKVEKDAGDLKLKGLYLGGVVRF